MSNDDNDRLRRILKSEEETQGVYNPAPIEPPAKTTEKYYRPALDKDNMPLPRRVDETDVEGTRVTRAAYQIAPNSQPQQSAPAKAAASVVPPSSFRFASFRNMGCFLRGLIAAAFIAVIMGLCTGSYFVYKYYSIASELPEVGDLRDRASQFETTRILDRNGQVLYEILDPNAGRRTYIPLSEISPNLVAATIATEDKDFYSNPGFDPVAIVRALWQNYVTGGQGGGASTITQQLARALILSPEERSQRTVTRKAREIILAAEITRRYTKDEIIELYLNEIYYGNLAYGVEAAAETYFGKSAKVLTMGEASFLAGLPQSPAVYDIYTNADTTLIRQQQVLVLMFEISTQQGCIEVSNSDTPVCVDATIATQAADEMKVYAFRTPSFDAKYPHWVNFVRSQLEEQYDAQTIYRSGFVIYTTLDPVMQDKAQQLITDQVAAMVDNNTHNGALVAIRPSTGEILAMVGSPDFYNDAISGQINMATSPTRQPGSSIKPFTYIAAFEKGWTPSTLIWDVPTQFPDGVNPPYEPRNYDGKFHGGLTVRLALSNSFNIPAVKALEFVGIYDDPNTPEKEGLIGMAERLGITSLTRNDYGLSLTLGGGDVSLIDMTSAYSVIANGGQRMPPVSILKITDFAGNIIYEYKPEAGEQVIRAEHAYLISSILSDNEARSFTFGRNSALNLSFPVAAKTGTTNDIRDNWTMGYTPDLVTGVWVGNADYTPMVSSSGLSGAAPVWSQFMEFAVPYLTNGAPTPFNRPAGIMDKVVCRLSGTEPSNSCNNQYTEVYASDQPPLPSGQDLARRVKIDLWTGLEASDACKGPTEDETVLNISDKWARDWLGTEDGRFWLEDHGLPRKPYYAPDRECNDSDPQPILEINLNDGEVITSAILEIKGSAAADQGFKKWILEYGSGADPASWIVLSESNNPVKDNTLYSWNLTSIPNGIISLRLTLIGDKTEVEKRITLNLSLPLPTVPTSTPTETPAPTLTPTETPTLEIIIPTETPSPTLFPTETPTETPIATP
ncbi:MAG: transglycosylase domain-containing protein [Anaerolineales bacterium]|nr:transglycosylase domain-containing protein [Anaerolineales bacterium]